MARRYDDIDPDEQPRVIDEHDGAAIVADSVEFTAVTPDRSRPSWRTKGRRHRHRYRRGRLLITALVILLLVPAGVLALRSLWVSIDAAADLRSLKAKQAAQERMERQAHGAFADTAAARFPEAEAGVVLPEAGQVGNWSPEQVGTATTAVRQLLVTARIDPRSHTGDVGPYIEQLGISARTFVTDRLDTELGLSYVTRLAPETTLEAKPRVQGTMTVSVGDAGQLVIVADYVWVYALTQPIMVTSQDDIPGSQLAVVHSIERYEWFPDKGYLPEDRGLRPSDGELYAFNVDCEFAAQGRLALPQVPVTTNASPIAEVLDPKKPPGELQTSC